MTPYLFFDLDGTLTDSAPGIFRSIAYALQKHGYPVPPAADLQFFIGPPLVGSFEKLCNVSEEKALELVDSYREYYHEKGIFECSVYDGIPALLQRLKDSGAELVLATCKPTVSAARVIEHFGLKSFFTLISGPELDGTRNEKHEVIDYALKALQLSPEQVLMIGDRRDDVLGALKNRIGCIGVLWGFGSAGELTSAGAETLVSTPADLEKKLSDRMRQIQQIA